MCGIFYHFVFCFLVNIFSLLLFSFLVNKNIYKKIRPPKGLNLTLDLKADYKHQQNVKPLLIHYLKKLKIPFGLLQGSLGVVDDEWHQSFDLLLLTQSRALFYYQASDNW